MGNKQGTPEPAPVEVSSGFHLLEIHLPTVGLGITSLFLLLAGVCAWSYCKRRCSRIGRGQTATEPMRQFGRMERQPTIDAPLGSSPAPIIMVDRGGLPGWMPTQGYTPGYLEEIREHRRLPIMGPRESAQEPGTEQAAEDLVGGPIGRRRVPGQGLPSSSTLPATHRPDEKKEEEDWKPLPNVPSVL